MGIREEKRLVSTQRLDDLRNRLSCSDAVKRFEDLTIFATGSYARGEASSYSDIDLFFVQNGKLNKMEDPNICQLRMFSDVIAISDVMRFPKFSNDGLYLKVIETEEILQALGGPSDDHSNYFTARLLMILESKWLYNKNSYDMILKSILGAYFKDYPDHPKNFRPTFLVNDVLRFWKTLCLNYENKRNQPETGDPKRVVTQKIKNLKLKFSRMLTCFGSICYIVSINGKIDLEDIVEMSNSSPLERLEAAVRKNSDTSEHLSVALEEYEWFLNLTNVPENDLVSSFSDKGLREKAFRRADRFGEAIYIITKCISERNNYLRYLVV